MRIGLIGATGRLGKQISQLHLFFPISRDTPRQNLPCDVLIDVSSPDALKENLSANLPIVIGTTGHKDFSLIHEAAKRFPIFYTANFSLGVALLHKLAAFTNQHFPAEIELTETHHVKKKDAPSGTALSLHKIVPRAKIKSIREGEVVGEHKLLFKQEEEELILSHKALSRSAFAKGALRAAYFLYGKKPGLYNMDNLLDEESPRSKL